MEITNDDDYLNEANEEEKNDINANEQEEQNEEEHSKKTKSSFFGSKNSKEDKLKDKCTSLESKNQELNDKFIRLFSEFDNYKKRTQKERLELIDTASERVIEELLPIMDDFERAIKANETAPDINTIKEGFGLIYSKFLNILLKNSVKDFGKVNEDFDTDKHEAVAHIPVEDKNEKGKVLDVIQKGYMIKNKIIRYAKVVVGY